MSRTEITIAIPAYNSEDTILETIKSARAQTHVDKEILLCDDGCTDKTVAIAKAYSVRVIHNEVNKGIGYSLERLMASARGKYIVFLCGDDVFTHPLVCHDIVKVFEENFKLGVIGRFYYQFMNGYPGAIMVSRDRNIFTQSCNPSGMAFRRVSQYIFSTNDIFIEMPTIVKNYLLLGWEWAMFEWDTIAARIHPGGNTGTKESYYKGSMYQNWYELMGQPLWFPQGFVQIKNRSPKTLWREICTSIRLDPASLLNPLSWFYILTAIIVPSKILKHLSNFYRHRITRRFIKIIPRGDK